MNEESVPKIAAPTWDAAWEIDEELDHDREVALPQSDERDEHIVHGTRAEISPDTFRRQWKPKHVPYVRPVIPEPIVAKKIIDYALSRTKTGKINGVHVLDPAEITLPAGAKKMITVLDGLPGWGVIASYALGWRINVNGTLKMRPIWGKTATEDGQEKRVKIGEEDPGAVDNILVRGYAENEAGLVFLAGCWISGKFEEGHVVAMPNIRRTKVGWQPSKTKERAIGQRNALVVPTLSEWLALAPTMTVKDEPPAPERWRSLMR